MSEDFKRTTRRAVLGAGAGLIAVATATAARAQDAKVPQSAVQYQTSPKDGQRCDACVNWQPPNACKIVEGNIVPQGYCVAFAPKGS